MRRFDIRLGMAIAVLVLGMAADTSAQRLLEVDGIELRGAAQLVMLGAGICNIVEASHTEAEYERIQANHGAPMDVWRLVFSVRNGSGRWLDHLVSRFEIDSEWPDCTNWSGPDDVQLRELSPAVPLKDMTVGWSGAMKQPDKHGGANLKFRKTAAFGLASYRCRTSLQFASSRSSSPILQGFR